MPFISLPNITIPAASTTNPATMPTIAIASRWSPEVPKKVDPEKRKVANTKYQIAVPPEPWGVSDDPTLTPICARHNRATDEDTYNFVVVLHGKAAYIIVDDAWPEEHKYFLDSFSFTE